MHQSSNILVIGGTGKTGRKVVEGLRQQGQNVRIGARSQTPAFDWSNPDTWATALEGMDKMYIVFYPDLAVPGAQQAIKGLIEKAKAAGVKKAVLLSGKGEVEAERCEQIVAQSGLDYTLVRASWFNQNFSESFLLEPILAGHLALPMPEARIPFVDTTDIAEVVIEALLKDDFNGQTLEVTGPRLLSFEEAAKEIADAIGKPISYEPITIDEFSAHLTNEGIPADYVWLLTYLFREVLSQQKNQVVSHDIEKVLGRKAIDFQEYVATTARTGIWNTAVEKVLN